MIPSLISPHDCTLTHHMALEGTPATASDGSAMPAVVEVTWESTDRLHVKANDENVDWTFDVNDAYGQSILLGWGAGCANMEECEGLGAPPGEYVPRFDAPTFLRGAIWTVDVLVVRYQGSDNEEHLATYATCVFC